MISTCPSCLSPIAHEVHSLDVLCDCGVRFSSGGMLSPAEEVPNLLEETPNSSNEWLFKESETVFAELRHFGETLTEKKFKAGEPIITGGSEIPGYRIESYLSPISLWATLESGGDPLARGYLQLWTRAVEKGADAVLCTQWMVSGDRVLLTGTPVKCSKVE